MEDVEMILGYCPACGKKLQIPGDLEQFACMYCATKMKKDQLLAEPPVQAEPERGDLQAEFQAFQASVLSCVTEYQDSFKKINKTDFSDYSDRYLAACRPVFDHLERCARIEPDRYEYWGERGAENFMAQVNEWLQSQPGWTRKHKRRNLVDNTKFTIALFLIPMLSRVNWMVAKPFAKKVNAMWLAQYPDSPFTLATYQDLINGFKKRWLCFITTAICQAEGKPDDCAELTAFRRFRDGWLMQQPDGPALIEEYYEIAPAIVMHIDYCDHSAARYAELRRRYLQPCYDALQTGRMEDCKRTYVAMVRDMQRRYLKNETGSH